MNIIQFSGESLTMSSREIAELTEKRHGDVIRDTRVMLEALGDDADLRHLQETKDSRGYTVEISLPKDLTLTLVSGYNVKLRKRIIDRWMELEEKATQPAIPQTLPEALRLAAEAIEKSEKLALENKAQAEALAVAAPKVEALERFSDHDGMFNIRNSAKLLGVPEKKFVTYLLANDWAFRDHAGRLCAKASKIAAGYMDTKPVEIFRTDGIQTVPQPVITQRGLAKLGELMARDGLLPKPVNHSHDDSSDGRKAA